MSLDKMRLFIVICIWAISLLSTQAIADVVVFVHGLGGFGPDELLGLGYWGFPKVFPGQDYLKIFSDRGHRVVYASVGPVSSNHDRACELYAQIKGTLVDYGQVHSQRYGHSRFGKDYTGKGAYPAWDGTKKIHLIGHSMGGNTIRVLEYYLQNGIPEEVAATGSGTSPLFKASKSGGNTWIQSIFTIATPHDGSSLHTKLGPSLVKFIKDLVGTFAAVMGLLPSSPEWGYNLDLEHFGLARKSGENFWTYFDRVFQSPIFSASFKDLASWDLSPQWSREFNAKNALAYSETYYFSASTLQTHSCWWSDQCSDIDAEFLMGATANLIGDLDGLCDTGGFCYDNSWEPSDGLVPTRSSRSPQVGVLGYVSPLTWNPAASSFVRGRWQTKEYNRDHLQIIGFRLNPLTLNAADGLYGAIADTIDKIRLPASSEIEAGIILVREIEAPSSKVAAIAAGVTAAAMGVIGIVVVVVVWLRRRRHQTGGPITAFSSKMAAGSRSSSRKLGKTDFYRSSVTLQQPVSTANPTFAYRESSSLSLHSPVRIDA